MPKTKTRIAVQSKGRLRDDSLKFLQSKGIMLPTVVDRTLLVQAINAPIEIAFIRHSDIPRYVQSGAMQYGIVGQNVLHEYEPMVTALQRLDFGVCDLVIAVPAQSQIKTIQDLNGHRIATSYPNSLRKFLRAQGIAASIIEISGSVEIAPQLNLADAICDLSQSGNTLRAHGLIPIYTILSSTATLVVSPHFTPDPTDLLFA